jgi:mitochondrial fission protein ELM1
MPAVNPQSNPEVWWQRMDEKSAPVKKSVANAMWFVITEDNISGGLRVATSPTARHTHFE